MIYEWTAVLGGGQGDGSSAFIANMGSGPCIVMLKRIREKLGKKPGDTVKIRLWHDTEPRVVEPPADLAEAMRADAAAQTFWDALSPGNRRLYVGWIEDAKKPETRRSRIEKTVAKLALGQKFS